MNRYPLIDAIERAIVVLVLAIGAGLALFGAAAPLLKDTIAGPTFVAQQDDRSSHHH